MSNNGRMPPRKRGRLQLDGRTPSMSELMESLPAHDPEAESSTLGAILIEPRAAAIAFDDLRPDDFYLPQNRSLFSLMSDMNAAGVSIDEMTVVSRAREAGLLTSALSPEYIGSLIFRTPSAASIEAYIEIVKRRRADRDTHTLGMRLLTGAHKGQGTALLEEFGISEPQNLQSEYLTVSKLLKYDFKNDPNVLISDGWLTKGNLYGIVGQTGLGKSSFAVHAAMSWAVGLPVFGLTPTRPLKCIIIQGENSPRIVAREVMGVFNGVPGIAEHEQLLEENVHIYRESRFAGEDFHKFVRQLIRKHNPDLVFIDPWFSFVGGNVNEQAFVSSWLRNGLMPLGMEFGTSFIILHHPPKPSRDPKSKVAYEGGDWSYFGAGSAEFANACRCILTLRESGDGLYELRAAKNQEGFPLTESDEPNAPKVNTCFIKHGDRGIYWQRASEADLSGINGAMDEEVSEILDVLSKPSPDGLGWRHSSILAEIQKIRGGTPNGAKTFFRRSIAPRLSKVAGIYTVKSFKVSGGFKQVSETA